MLLPSELMDCHHLDAQEHTYNGTSPLPELDVELVSRFITFYRLQMLQINKSYNRYAKQVMVHKVVSYANKVMVHKVANQ